MMTAQTKDLDQALVVNQKAVTKMKKGKVGNAAVAICYFH